MGRKRYRQETYMVEQRGCGTYVLWFIIIAVLILVVL